MSGSSPGGAQCDQAVEASVLSSRDPVQSLFLPGLKREGLGNKKGGRELNQRGSLQLERDILNIGLRRQEVGL